MIKDKLIMIDLDSTILDTSSTIISLHNRLYPSKYIEFTSEHDWQFRPMIDSKEELSDLFKLFDHEDFYKDVIVFPNAIEIINKLAENNRVVICSKHNESRKRLSTEWINKVMPKVEIIFVDSFDKSVAVPRGEFVDIFIDDKPEALYSMGYVAEHCICYGSYQWNQEWNGDRSLNWVNVRSKIEAMYGDRI